MGNLLVAFSKQNAISSQRIVIVYERWLITITIHITIILSHELGKFTVVVYKGHLPPECGRPTQYERTFKIKNFGGSFPE